MEEVSAGVGVSGSGGGGGGEPVTRTLTACCGQRRGENRAERGECVPGFVKEGEEGGRSVDGTQGAERSVILFVRGGLRAAAAAAAAASSA